MAKLEIIPVKPEEFTQLISYIDNLKQKYLEASGKKWDIKKHIKELGLSALFPFFGPGKRIAEILREPYFKQIAESLEYYKKVLTSNYERNEKKGIHRNVLIAVRNAVESAQKDLLEVRSVFEKAESALFNAILNGLKATLSLIDKLFKAAGEIIKPLVTGIKILPFVLLGGAVLTGIIIYRLLKSETGKELTKIFVLKKALK